MVEALVLMLYEKKSFTVPVVEKAPEVCDHTEPWVTDKGLCVMCGAVLREPDPEPPKP